MKQIIESFKKLSIDEIINHKDYSHFLISENGVTFYANIADITDITDITKRTPSESGKVPVRFCDVKDFAKNY